jgi:hypothetical protein
MWALIIIISALCGYNNPVYFGAGFCIGYIIHSISSKVDSILAEAMHEVAEEMRLEREAREKEEDKE